MTSGTNGALLTVRGLTKHFHQGVWPRKQTIVAVDDIDLHVARGESVGLVGESGSGKTTTARSILRLVDPTAGEVDFDGIRVDRMPRPKVRRLYRNMQMVFQDPNSSLNPRMTVREIVTEPLKLHLKMSGEEREARANEIMTLVGLRDFHLDRYPGQLSGGQRQRVGIGRAIATPPKLVFLDEPTSPLDVSVHDLGVVRQLSKRVLVMFEGRIVEEGPTRRVFEDPRNDYTKRLLAAIPSMDGYRRRRLQGGTR